MKNKHEFLGTFNGYDIFFMSETCSTFVRKGTFINVQEIDSRFSLNGDVSKAHRVGAHLAADQGLIPRSMIDGNFFR